jgi:membrane-bound serine protease (ClpP class)
VWRRNPRIAEAMVDEDVVLPVIKETGKILTFTTEEALKNGYCDGIAESIDDLLQMDGIKEYQLSEYKPGSIDKIISFLLNPFVHGILIMLIIGGIYFELQTPGIGFPLAVAVMAALLYFAPLYLEGLAKNWEILIFVVGLILLGIELFVIPGFGVAGFSGIALIITGLTLSMIDNTNFQLDSTKGLQEVLKALFIVVTSIAIAFGLSIYLSKQLFTRSMFGELALKTVQETKEGYLGVDASLQNLVGQSGYAHTILRPSGKISLGEEIYDATSLIGYIEKGERIKIVRFQAGQLYVVRDESGA